MLKQDLKNLFDSGKFSRFSCILWINFLILLLFLLTSCGLPGSASSSEQLPIVQQQQVAQPLLPISFPQDEGAHNDLTEWWYYTGHLQATDATGAEHRYGFELVIFRVSRSDLPVAYPAHFAISDLNRGEFHYDQNIITKANDHPTTKGIDEQVGQWSIRGLNGHDHLIASMNNYAIDLDLTANNPPVLQNGKGIITYGLAGPSYYYSRPRMDVAGTVVDHGQSLQVHGLAWMDHQWGNFLVPSGEGWDWYSIQLDNLTEMMIYLIHDTSGKITSSYASYVDPTGKTILLSPNAIHITTLNTWTSPATGITYPSGWHLEINDPQLQAILTITPLLKDQELVTTLSTGHIYWEGAVSVQGQTNGQGYVELTGYSHPPTK